MIQMAVVRYTLGYNTYKSPLMGLEEAQLFFNEAQSKGQRPRLTKYNMGATKLIARKAASLYNATVRLEGRVSRAAATNRGRVQSTAEMRARTALQAAENEYHRFCQANNIDRVW